MTTLTINNLVDKIYALNDVKDGFWKDNLERIRLGMKVTWYHAAGFDLRPLQIIKQLAQPSSIMNKIGLELYNTDLVYSNIGYGMGHDYYETFMNIWKKKSQGMDLTCSDLPPFTMVDCPPHPNAYLSVEPFSIFSKEERLTFENGQYGESANPNRDFDGFAIILRYCTKTHITIIYLCLDDFIVKRLIDEFNINVVCVFENSPNRPDLGHLFDIPDGIKGIKYVFSDGRIPTEHFDVWRLGHYPIECISEINNQGTFDLAINKNVAEKYKCPLSGSSYTECLRLTDNLANPSSCPYADKKIELNQSATQVAEAERERKFDSELKNLKNLGFRVGQTDDEREDLAWRHRSYAGFFRSSGSFRNSVELMLRCELCADANKNFLSDQQRRIIQSMLWMQEGLCRYCGSEMQGRFKKKCKSDNSHELEIKEFSQFCCYRCDICRFMNVPCPVSTVEPYAIIKLIAMVLAFPIILVVAAPLFLLFWLIVLLIALPLYLMNMYVKHLIARIKSR